MVVLPIDVAAEAIVERNDVGVGILHGSVAGPVARRGVGGDRRLLSLLGERRQRHSESEERSSRGHIGISIPQVPEKW